MGNALKEWLEAILNLVYPRNIQCMLCDNELFEKEDYSVCECCREEIYWLEDDVCKCCGRFLGHHSTLEVCGDCQKTKRAYRQNISVALYNEAGKILVHQLKYGDQSYVAFHMAHMMADRLHTFPEVSKKIDLIVPVPIHEKRYRERGFNQSEWIGKFLSERIQRPCLKKVLKRTRYTNPQTQLNREERLKNLKGAFQVMDEEVILGKRILVIDDVFTTGSTIQETAKELIKMGAYEVYSMTFAAAVARER